MRSKRFTHQCGDIRLSSLPPAWPNHCALLRCPYRTKFYALSYGGHGGHGIGYEWLGWRLEIGKHHGSCAT
jgi:hypothetical protein